MNEIKVTQLSDEWFKLRLGKITASKFGDLMKTPKQRLEWNQTQTSILLQTASEFLTGEREETFTSKSMQWGIDTEKEAIEFYELLTDQTVRESGFYEVSEYIGGSPDGIIEGQGALEIKCPNSKQHLKYLLDANELIKMYKWQAIGHIYTTGLQWCDLISFDPRFKDPEKMMVIQRFNKSDLEAELKELHERLESAVEVIEGWLYL